ncbi:MAG: hypothetical protein QF450_10650, partial [Rhodospirillales bacterium]|nr:hypothetical protein [Rhodospirillales bacterium]
MDDTSILVAERADEAPVRGDVNVQIPRRPVICYSDSGSSGKQTGVRDVSAYAERPYRCRVRGGRRRCLDLVGVGRALHRE